VQATTQTLQPRWEGDKGLPEASVALFDQLDVEGIGTSCSTVRREVICRDALAWLREQETLHGHVVSSLPDITEIDLKSYYKNKGDPVSNYRLWFAETVGLVLSKLAPNAVAVFYQSDGRHDGIWLDKSFLAQTAAEQAGCELLFHKIVLFSPELEATQWTHGKGRPQYSHMLAFSKNLRAEGAWFDECESHLFDPDSHETHEKTARTLKREWLLRFLSGDPGSLRER